MALNPPWSRRVIPHGTARRRTNPSWSVPTGSHRSSRRGNSDGQATGCRGSSVPTGNRLSRSALLTGSMRPSRCSQSRWRGSHGGRCEANSMTMRTSLVTRSASRPTRKSCLSENGSRAGFSWVNAAFSGVGRPRIRRELTTANSHASVRNAAGCGNCGPRRRLRRCSNRGALPTQVVDGENRASQETARHTLGKTHRP